MRGGRSGETAERGWGTLECMGTLYVLCRPPWGRVAGPGVILTTSGLRTSRLRPVFLLSSHPRVGGGIRPILQKLREAEAVGSRWIGR